MGISDPCTRTALLLLECEVPLDFSNTAYFEVQHCDCWAFKIKGTPSKSLDTKSGDTKGGIQ